MNPNRLPDLQRRALLRRSALLAGAGVAAPWALNLSLLADAAAADLSGGYKALVCVFLLGGNDHANTLVPYDAAAHAEYLRLRAGLGTPREQLAATALGAEQRFAMAPELAPLKPHFDAARLGWLLNVGTLMEPTSKAQYRARSVPLPPKLFSHNDQQSVWQSSEAEGSTRGWGGALGDLMLEANPGASATFTCVNAGGNAVFLAGQQALPYQVGNDGAVRIRALDARIGGSSAPGELLRQLVTEPRTHWMQAEHNRVTQRSIDSEGRVTAALTGATLATGFDEASPLGRQLLMVARLIAGREQLGAQRQVFMVQLGGFDNHDNLLDTHPGLLTQVAHGLASFQAAMQELGLAERVTLFTASDFGRTLTSNGNGSDHGWGSHHLVMGGAVRGGRFWGQAPVLANDGPDDVGQGRLLPSTAVDQYAATLARWMGVGEAELPLVLPRIGRFATRDLGFFNP
jgi:uncharacterized protein (DUF1501 family)